MKRILTCFLFIMFIMANVMATQLMVVGEVFTATS